MPENIIKECFVSMRDGVELFTLVQLPAAEGRYPVIVKRNPYCPEETDFEALKNEDTHGYAVITQHCRGTARSKGICIPYLNERNDGLDLLDWVRKQEFYNGEIFLWGSSYLSSVHFSYLNTNPPDVKAAFLPVQDSERYNILYRNGFYKTGLHGKWVVSMYKKNMDIERNIVLDTFRTMPLSGITRHIFNETVPEIEEEFLHPDPADDFWNTPAGGSDYRNVTNNCTIPILFATGFFDIYTQGIFDMWNNLAPERKKCCSMIVSPFAHSWNPPPRTVPSELPDFENARMSEVYPDCGYNWFDHFRKGDKLNFIEKGKISFYTLFENKWHTRDALPNAENELVFYLNADRTLSKTQPQSAEKITYTYNPYAPAEFKGGLCNNFGGMQIQDAPNSRYDIISFLSEPLEKDSVCEGRFEVKLHCSSSAQDTCFYARLSLVRDGAALGLRDDIDSLCRLEKEYTPGEERIINFTFGDISLLLKKGDVLRLDISSSCVPFFQVHTNQPGVQALHDRAEISRNTIITGSSYLKIFCSAQ